MNDSYNNKFWERFLHDYDKMVARLEELEKNHNSLLRQVNLLALKVSLAVSFILFAVKEGAFYLMNRH